MTGQAIGQPELPNIITIIEESFHDVAWLSHLKVWENVIFSLFIVAVLTFVAYLASRKKEIVPGRLQGAVELLVGGLDDFVCGVLGPKGRKYTPFIGTLFVYILCMNLSGLVPFFKSSTSSWSTTLALAICVFVYVQYTSIRELGAKGYLDHLMGNPRGFLAWSGVFPLMMFFVHVISELVRPISLSLRLRSNIWGDDMLLTVLAGFGVKGVPLLLFSSLLAIIASVVQTVVFCLLTTIYFALIMSDDGHSEEHTKEVAHGL